MRPDIYAIAVFPTHPPDHLNRLTVLLLITRKSNGQLLYQSLQKSLDHILQINTFFTLDT